MAMNVDELADFLQEISKTGHGKKTVMFSPCSGIASTISSYELTYVKYSPSDFTHLVLGNSEPDDGHGTKVVLIS